MMVETPDDASMQKRLGSCLRWDSARKRSVAVMVLLLLLRRSDAMVLFIEREKVVNVWYSSLILHLNVAQQMLEMVDSLYMRASLDIGCGSAPALVPLVLFFKSKDAKDLEINDQNQGPRSDNTPEDADNKRIANPSQGHSILHEDAIFDKKGLLEPPLDSTNANVHMTSILSEDELQSQHSRFEFEIQISKAFPDEENKIEDEGDMSQATQQVLPTIDEETQFHKGDTMSTQEVVEHESDFVAQKPSNDMNKGSENMLPTIGETLIHEGNTRNSEEKMVVVESQSDVQTSPKPSDDMIIKDIYTMPLRDEEVEGSEKKDEANEEHQGALATTEVQAKADKGTGEATRNANKAQSIQGRVQGTEGEEREIQERLRREEEEEERKILEHLRREEKEKERKILEHLKR
ncbi:hypothetical protein L7F22_065864 [Adiantum nelumboides]|nr:hypothetical protein [Adiantum nelumboides]